MGDTIAQIRFENVSKLSNDPLLARGNTLRSSEDSLKLNELMELYTNLQTRVLDLEKTKIIQANEIDSLKKRVKRLEKKKRSRTHGLKRLYKVGLIARVESSRDEESLDDADMFDVNTLTGDEVLAESEVAVKDVNLSVDEVTLAQALAALKSEKVQEKGDVIEEPSVLVSAASTKVSAATTTTIPTPRKGIVITELGTSTTTTISLQPSQAKVQDKGKGIMVEEPVKSMTKKDLVRLDEEIASKLQAEFHQEIKADHELAQRLQAQEQEELSDAEKATLFVQLLEKRRKYFAAKRAEEKRNKPPTQAQQRKIMCTYLKNMEGKKPKDLKNKSFDSIQKMFDKAFKRVNTFVDFRTDLVEGSSKRAGTELEQESIKKQKVDEDKETAELQSLIKVIPDEEELIKESSKKEEAEIAHESSLKRAGEKAWKGKFLKSKVGRKDKESEELNQCFEIIPDDGDDVTIDATPYLLNLQPLEDLEVLWSIVKARFKKTELVNYMDNFLLLNLKTMFEHHVEDNVWKNQQGLVKVLNWKLYDSCGVHCVTMQSMLFYLLVEKMYPLTNHTLHQMFNDVKLQVDYECEIAFELLRLVKKLIKEGYINIKFRAGLLGLKAFLKLLCDQVSILAKDKGFRHEMHNSEESEAVYGITPPKDYAVSYSNEEMRHHTLYGVKLLPLYAATFKFTRDDLSESALRRNIGDKVTP
ncbi:hypothetical protein Tco_0087109 [Tanacetum coccineum]